jgi:LPXTG-motif cell wall-anchored protein
MSSIASLVVAVSLGLVATASAQTYPPSGCELQLSTTRIVPGDTVRVEGCGFLPGTTVSFALHACGDVVDLGSVRADQDGGFSTAREIPEDISGGRIVLDARGRGADKRLVILRGVLGAVASCAPEEASAPSSGTDIRGGIPNTGIDLALVAAVGAALAAAGLALWGTRRKQD